MKHDTRRLNFRLTFLKRFTKGQYELIHINESYSPNLTQLFYWKRRYLFINTFILVSWHTRKCGCTLFSKNKRQIESTFHSHYAHHAILRSTARGPTAYYYSISICKRLIFIYISEKILAITLSMFAPTNLFQKKSQQKSTAARLWATRSSRVLLLNESVWTNHLSEWFHDSSIILLPPPTGETNNHQYYVWNKFYKKSIICQLNNNRKHITLPRL